jgi:glycosyltransferase involved in cell wall biosynthesis
MGRAISVSIACLPTVIQGESSDFRHDHPTGEGQEKINDMKIAQIAPAWITIPPKNYGGTESVLYHLIEELVGQGHDVTLFAPEDAKTSARQVSFFPNSLLAEKIPWQAHLKATYHLLRAVEESRRRKFDIVHSHLSSATDLYLFPLMASLATPHVTTLHSTFPFDRIGNWRGDADGYYMRWASEVPLVAISKSAREQARELHPLKFVGVVYNGISMQQYTTRSKRREDFFVWLGRFSPEKGTHLAIEAAQRAQVRLVLAGTIDRSSREASAYFQDVIRPEIDNEQIRYFGPANLRQKISLYSRARGFLNPIEWEEPFGMVMIEAMALGCPVISFARGAAPELIVDGKTGFLVRNVKEMVDCMARTDEIDRKVVRDHVDSNFSARVMAQRYVQVYEQIIASQKKAAPTAQRS